VRKAIGSPEHKRLCRLLREMRTSAGLSQVELADRLGVPQSFVSKYEGGQRRLDLIELRQITKALGTSLAELVSRLDDQPRTRRR
jgi:transcriptional regulator with XRE-family HTH domain